MERLMIGDDTVVQLVHGSVVVDQMAATTRIGQLPELVYLLQEMAFALRWSEKVRLG